MSLGDFLSCWGKGKFLGSQKRTSGIEKEAGDRLSWFPRSEGFPGIQNFQCEIQEIPGKLMWSVTLRAGSGRG